MINWLEQLSIILRKHKKIVLVTVIDTKGSTPREPGTKMIVSEQQIEGSIGGGNLEYQCIEIARLRLLSDTKCTWRRKTQRFPLGASLGQCCGGVVSIFFELLNSSDSVWIEKLRTYAGNNIRSVVITSLDNDLSEKKIISELTLSFDENEGDFFTRDCTQVLNRLLNQASSNESQILKLSNTSQQESFHAEVIVPNDFHIMIFGAGHVGKALVNVLSGLECSVTWVDNRDAQFPESVPQNTITQLEGDPEDAVDCAPRKTYYIVMTHCHGLDLRICERILNRTDISYCGLIGSTSKRQKFERRLLNKGYCAEMLNNLTCPIGINGISSKIPGEIAIAISAEILLIRDRITRDRVVKQNKNTLLSARLSVQQDEKQFL